MEDESEVDEYVPMSKHEKMMRLLSGFGINLGVDYTFTFKYADYHLLCHELFEPRILDVAKAQGITFKTIHTHK